MKQVMAALLIPVVSLPACSLPVRTKDVAGCYAQPSGLISMKTDGAYSWTITAPDRSVTQVSGKWSVAGAGDKIIELKLGESAGWGGGVGRLRRDRAGLWLDVDGIDEDFKKRPC